MEQKKKYFNKKTILISSTILIIFIIIIVCTLLFKDDKEIIDTSSNNDVITNIENEEKQQYIQIDGGLKGLIGKAPDEVTTILENAGLKVEVNEEKEFSDTVPIGYVTKCSGSRPTGEWHYAYEEMQPLEIAALKDAWKDNPTVSQTILFEKIYEYIQLTDTNLMKGDTLYLTISKGKEIIMPNLQGLTQNEAKQILIENNLIYKENIGSDVEKAKNTVLKQSVEPNESIEENTEVTVTINKLQEISIDVSSMAVGDEEVVVRLEFNDPLQRYKPITNDVNVSPNEKNFRCMINVGKQTNITIYINGNDIYSTTIIPDGSQNVIYIKNPNPVEERVLDIY